MSTTPASRKEKGNVAEEKLSALREFLKEHSATPDIKVDTPTQNPLHKRHKQESLAEKDIRKRTKKQRLDVEYQGAAKSRLRGARDDDASGVKELDVFEAHPLPGNEYTAQMVRGRGSTGWYLFICDDMTRQWFFAERVYQNFDPNGYPKAKEQATKWLQREICREQNDWLRESYADAWKLVMDRAVANGEVDWGIGEPLAMSLLEQIGGKPSVLDTKIRKIDMNVEVADTISERDNHAMVETVISCVGRLFSALAKHDPVVERIVQAFRVITICAMDSVMSVVGSTTAAQQLALLRATVDDLIWTSCEPIIFRDIFHTLHAHTLRRRGLETLQVAKSYCAKLKPLHQQLAIAFFLNTCEFEFGSTNQLLARYVLPKIQTEPCYPYANIKYKAQVRNQLLANSERFKSEFCYLTHGLLGLTRIECSRFSKKAMAKHEPRRDFTHYIEQLEDHMLKLDPARNNPALAGIHDALIGLRELLKHNYTEGLQLY